MGHEWHELTDLTAGRPLVITAVQLKDSGVTIQGEFDLPPLAQLRYEDQVFVWEFVRSHGSIKHMEKAFGISYPTVKNRLNRVIEQLPSVEVETAPGHDEVLGLLEQGEISAQEALERLGP